MCASERGGRCLSPDFHNRSGKAVAKKDKSAIYCLKKRGKYLERGRFFTDSQKRPYYRDFPFQYRVYSGDAEKLAEKIGYIAANLDRMQQLREQAFKTYEEAFTMEVFRGNMLSVFSELIGRQE